MLIEPLPLINKVFSLVVQQERQISIGIISEPKVLRSKTDSHGYQRPIHGRNIDNNNRKFGSGNQKNKVYTYYRKMKHIEDTCYRKHGFPPGFKFKNSTTNNVTIGYNTIPNENIVSNKILSDSGCVLSPKQYQRLMALLQQTNNNKDIHVTNNVSTSHVQADSCVETHSSQGNHFVMSYSSNDNSWLLDTGAIDYIYYQLSSFTSYKKIKPISIKLPDGSQLNACLSGIVHFQFNMILVSKLTLSLQCSLLFHQDQSLIQDLNSLKRISLAKIQRGLYAMIDPIVSLLDTIVFFSFLQI